MLTVFIGIATFAFLLLEPHIEGRNAHATLLEIYFKDLFLVYVYIASIPFFVVLYQLFKVLDYAGQNTIFSQAAVNAVRIIKYCGMAMIGFVAGGVTIILLGNSDDRPPVIFMGSLTMFGSIVIAAAAGRFEQIFKKGSGDLSFCRLLIISYCK